jgi:hypothetical protein
MTEFEMRFEWDDQEEAFHRKTKTHKQNGVLKTWRLEHETDKEYQERTRELINRKQAFLSDVVRKRHGRFANVTSVKFR